MTISTTPARVERWGIYEVALKGPTAGNPFADVQLTGRFTHQHRTIEVAGFYDGDGVYRLRLMPDTPGLWRYTTQSNVPALDGQQGAFECTTAMPGNHGPVGLRDRYHWVAADGAAFHPLGTTCYAWTHQGDALEEQTLATLRDGPFNKIRMCVFPKHYRYNENEPEYYPFVRDAAGVSDFARFDPAFFRHLELRLGQLRDLGIVADLILFHPYDRWGYATMDAASDDRYLRYLIARVVAYRNVWWSLANEYDLMKAKTLADWDRFFRVIQESDPYDHPRSIHNCREFYDHAKAWVTHQSIQRSDVEQTRVWREQYKKAVLIDECRYEGNIPNGWGNLTPQEMVRRFWEVVVRGGYCTHGETYLHPEDLLWWSKGGVLHGQSPARLAFLRQVLEEGPDVLDPVDGVQVGGFSCVGQPGVYYLTYYGIGQPGEMNLALPEDVAFRGELLDTWEMTVAPIPGELRGKITVQMPSKPYMAIRIRKV